MFRIIDTLLFTLERLWQHRLLVIWVLVGLAVATTLALSLSLYVDSVYTELLTSRLDNPPYAFRFRYLGAWNGNITEADVNAAGVAIQQGFTATIGLPVEQSVTYVHGGSWTLRMADNTLLNGLGLGAMQGAESKMSIVEGEWPPSDTPDDGTIPALATANLLYQMGLQVGDHITAQRPGGDPVTLRIAALWQPVDPNDPAWIFPIKFFDQVLLIRPDDLWTMIQGVDTPVDEAAWYLVFDGSKVRTSDVGPLLGRITDGYRLTDAVLPGIRHEVSPEAPLQAFSDEVNTLTKQLIIIIAPVVGLVLYFVALVADLLVSRQQAEDVKLRSRGMSRRALLAVHVLMWLVLVVAALLVGLWLAPYIVRLVGQTTSFLRFDSQPTAFAIVLTPQALIFGVLTGLIAASSGLYLAWRTTGYNINSFRQRSARAGRAWWQRAYLDILLLFPAIYVLYTLWQQGGLVANVETPFSNPLAFVGPTLFALGFALLFLRLWPILLRLGAGILSYTRSVALLMALRELTRSIGRYRGALLMMAFTLSLTGFTASMASTLDKSLADTVDYKVGADLVIVPPTEAQTDTSQDSSTGQVTYTVTGYNMPPTEELLAVDGVASVSRVGRYDGQLIVGGQRLDGTILGVDRGSLAAVTRFRADYASEPLANLLNELAGNRTGILLSRTTAETYNIIIGQNVTVQFTALNNTYQTSVPVIDFVDYFPTLDPSKGFFLITNLDPIFELVGSPLPYDVWLGLKPGVDPKAVEQRILDIQYPVLNWEQPEAMLAAARAEPGRRGVLGFLSVGFVAAIALTLIAAVIQSVSSFREQSSQLGALRAMGLGALSVGVYVIMVQGLAAASGIFSGTSIGMFTTLLFLPLLDFSGGLPPYQVRVAWSEIVVVYAVFSGVLFVVTLFTTLVLSREHVATIIRLGE